jgi:hypothetical protein
MLAKRPRSFVAKTTDVALAVPRPANTPAAAPQAKPAVKPVATTVATGPWQAHEEQAESGASLQRPFVVRRTDLPHGPEYLNGQGGRKRRFGSLEAAAAVAETANRDGV